jgi:uncharacterized SAM-dependent methyltransferase
MGGNMSKIEQLSSPSDNAKLEEMDHRGYQCIQVFTDGENWFGLFVLKPLA